MSVDLEELCVGLCMNGYRRKVRTHQASLAQHAADMQAWRIPLIWPEAPAEPRLPYPVFGEPAYCPDCGYDIKAKLSKLDGAACVYLREADGMRGQSDEAKVSRSGEPASPSPTLDDLDDLDSWLRSWRGAYLGTDTMARQGSLPDSITLGASWLVVRTERILARPELAADFGREVGEWYSKLQRHDPSEVVVERLPAVRCPECRGRTLERKVGDDRVTCRMRDCERVLKLSEYRELEQEARQEQAKGRKAATRRAKTALT